MLETHTHFLIVQSFIALIITLTETCDLEYGISEA